MLGESQEAAYFHRENNFENRLIGTFHAGLCSKDQKTIIQSCVKEESYERLKILWHTYMLLPHYHLYLPYQPLASTVVLNHTHPNVLQT
jgi:hypothetical protein